jgi:hypothetical protein
MQRTFILSLAAIMIGVGSAAADPPRLKGTYGFTGSDACLYSPNGFTEQLQVFNPNWSSSNDIAGTRTFNGDGTGTGENFTMSITLGPGVRPSASSSHGTVSFTYTVNPDGSFTINNVPGSNVATILTGPRAGQTSLLENVPTTTGLISKDGKTLTTANLTPGVETQKFSNNDTELRICHRSRVFIKLDTD